MVARPDYFEHVCVVCGKAFTAETDGVFTCSPECKAERYRKSRARSQADKLAEAEDLYNNGLSLTRIEREIGIAARTVSKFLRDKGYEIATMRASYTKRDKCLRKDNSLAVAYPELAAEWCCEKNTKTPDQVYPHSGKIYTWNCPKGIHEPYDAPVHERVDPDIQRGCPGCAGKTVTNSNRLSIINPAVAAEWHPTKNGTVTPHDVSYASNEKYWWLCPRNPLHEWETAPAFRTRAVSPTGCPHCRQTSLEIRLYTELAALFPKVECRAKVYGMEVDVYLPEIAVGIEIDGEFWHKKRLKEDTQKTQRLNSRGISLIRIRDIGLPLISDIDIQFNTDVHSEEDDISLMRQICSRLLGFVDASTASRIGAYMDCAALQNNVEYIRLRHGPLLPGTSLLDQFPHIAAEWDYEANYPLIPEHVTPGQRLKVGWFHTASDGSVHRWTADIYNRTSKNGRGCNICSSTVLVPEKSLAVCFPEIAKEWHPTLNGDRTPENTFAKAGYEAYWLCPKCGNTYTAIVAKRTVRKQGCKCKN